MKVNRRNINNFLKVFNNITAPKDKPYNIKLKDCTNTDYNIFYRSWEVEFVDLISPCLFKDFPFADFRKLFISYFKLSKCYNPYLNSILTHNSTLMFIFNAGKFGEK